MTGAFAVSSWGRVVSLLLLAALVLASGLVVRGSRWTFASQDREEIGAPSNARHSTGTDDLGRDRTVRVALALLLALGGAAAAALLATTIAALCGGVGAFLPPVLGKLVLFASDLLLTLPWLFLLLIVRSALPLTLPATASAAITFLLLGLLGWPAFVRVIFARTAALRSAEWMFHARAMGLRPVQVAGRHVLPHLLPLLLTLFLIYVPVCVTAEANLGALGLGISEPLPSWGSMLLSLKSTSVLNSSGWVYLPLGLLVGVLLLLEFTVIGEEA